MSTLPPVTCRRWLQRSPASPTRSGRLGRNALAVVLAGLLLVVGKAGPAQAHVVGIGGHGSLGLGMVAATLLDQRTARPTTRPRGKAG